VPVRVTKQWVSYEQRGNTPAKSKFIPVRVSVLRDFPPPDYSDCPKEEPWTSSPVLVESRERLQTLLVKGDPEGEPVLREAGYDQRWLPLGDLSQLSAAQAAQTLDNQQGGRE
jgi:hypothetical protein